MGKHKSFLLICCFQQQIFTVLMDPNQGNIEAKARYT